MNEKQDDAADIFDGRATGFGFRPQREVPVDIPGMTRQEKARWLANAALEEIPEGSDVTSHCEGIETLLGSDGCETCGGLGEVEAGGAAYDGLRTLLGIRESADLPCPDCQPTKAMTEILQLADNEDLNWIREER